LEEQTVSLLNHWLEDEAVHEYIGVNRYGGIDWFNQESFEEVLWWLFLIAVLEIIATQPEDQLRAGQLPASVLTHIRKCFSVVENLLSAQERSGYQLEKLISSAQQKELA
jgi:hypothetical protein